MGSVIGEILPLALAVTISPVPIIAEILLLFSTKPKANGAAYLLGFCVGVGGVLALFVALASTQDLADSQSGASTAAAWLKILLGLLLFAAAAKQLRGRPAAGEPAAMPKWMDGIASFTPGKSVGIGTAIGAVNPKNLAVGLSAAVVIAGAGLSTAEGLGAGLVYVAVAALGIAVPLGVAVVMGDRSKAILDSWRDWLAENNAVVMAVLFAVIGMVLIGDGITALSA